MWRELWWKMADGKNYEYEKIKSTNVFEFYNVLKLWREQIQRENDYLKARNQKK